MPPTAISVVKSRLRAQLLARRAGRSSTERHAAAAGLARHLGALPEIADARRVTAYVGVGDEPGTGALLDEAAARGLEVLLPVALPGGRLAWAAYTGTADLVTGRFGLREPAGPRLGPGAVAEADLLLVPALAVDRAGHRLGRGGGHYDRLLASLARPAYAVVFDDEVLDDVPVEAHDRSVSGALTPSGVVPLVER